MVIITFGNVVSRYILHASLSFTEEITTVVFVWISFLGASVATKRKGHLGFSAIVDMFPEKYKKAAGVFTTLCGFILFAVLLKFGIDMVISQYKTGHTSPALGWPGWLFGISIPVGALILVLRFLQLAYMELKGGVE